MPRSIARFVLSIGAAAVILGLYRPAPAAAQTAFDFYVGGFSPQSLASRPTDDVLYNDAGFLTFGTGEFNNVTVGADWLVKLNDYFDAGLGVGFYTKTASAFYTNFVNPDGSNIYQNLGLRIVPISATIRVLPLGHLASIRPYIGAGVGILIWRYSESGNFLDQNNNVYQSSYSGSGTTVGPEVLGGLTVPIGAFGIGFEVRWQGGEGTLPTNQGFAGPKIDLAGVNYLATFNLHF